MRLAAFMFCFGTVEIDEHFLSFCEYSALEHHRIPGDGCHCLHGHTAE